MADTGSQQNLAEEEYDYLLKIVVVGDTGVGKSNLLSRFLQNKFKLDTQSTIGVQFVCKDAFVSVDESQQPYKVKMQLWDTCGQERYRSMTQTYYRGAAGALLVYDITNTDSFLQCEKWVSELLERADQGCQIIIVGNKCDLEDSRQVQQEEGENLAQRLGALFTETSALDGHNVHGAFQALLQKIVTEKAKKSQNDLNDDVKPQKIIIDDTYNDTQNGNEKNKKQKSCC